jgi:hypothetical protein
MTMVYVTVVWYFDANFFKSPCLFWSHINCQQLLLPTVKEYGVLKKLVLHLNTQRMMMSCCNRLMAICLLCLSCTSSCIPTQTTRTPVQKTDTMPAAALHPFGRAVLNNAGHLELISSAAHFSFSFEGTECRIVASLPGGHNYLQYELDGTYESEFGFRVMQRNRL